MTIKKIAFLALAVLVLSSCASSYKSIEPSSFNFRNKELNDGVELKYEYEVLEQRGNKKFAKDETKRGLKVIAVEITNHTEETLVIGESLKFFSGESELIPLPPATVTKKINQCAACYLPYALLTLMTLNTSSGNGNVQSYPIGLVVGPIVTGVNIGVAASANKKLKRVLIENDIAGRSIEPGATVTGLITVGAYSFSALKPRVVKG